MGIKDGAVVGFCNNNDIIKVEGDFCLLPVAHNF